MKRNGILVIAAIAGALIVGTVVWQGYRMDRRIDALQADLSAQQPSLSSVGSHLPPRHSATAALPSPEAPVTLDAFAPLWTSDLAQEAETKCWGPIVADGGFVEGAPEYEVWVDEAGRIEKLTAPRIEGDPSPPSLYDCLANVARRVKFPPTGARRTGRIQLQRPSASPRTPNASSR